jgi:hypothetical protein
MPASSLLENKECALHQAVCGVFLTPDLNFVLTGYFPHRLDRIVFKGCGTWQPLPLYLWAIPVHF